MEGDLIKGIGKIQYKPDASPGETLVFKHYNAEEIIYGKTMADWLRFSVCYWHTFRGTGMDPFGVMTLHRSWDDLSSTLNNAERRLRVAFEFILKLGVKFYTFHDVFVFKIAAWFDSIWFSLHSKNDEQLSNDIAPAGSTLEETNHNLDVITDLALVLQKETGIRPLWVTCNLFSHPRYMNGASSNPDAHVVAYAAAQVKKGLEIAKKLGAENFVFWNGRDGYQTLLNTDVHTELSHMASFLKMAVEYKQKIGFTGQFLIEPKPKEPSKHQYDYDAMTVIAFLRTFGLEQHFKFHVVSDMLSFDVQINVEPNHTTLAGHCYEHDIVFASAFNMLGSIDANTGSPDLGWDTDQFPMDVKNCTMIMKTVIQQGGIQPGGLNFDAKVRRESTDVVDIFISHIGAMDTFARGLRSAARIIEDGLLDKHVKDRYASFSSDVGLKIAEGSSSLEECEEFVKKHGEPEMRSGKQEHLEALLNYYV